MGVFEQLKEWVMKEEHSNPAGSANARSDPALGNPLKDSNNRRLAESIDEAGLLIWYTSKKGIGDIDTKAAEIIADTKEKFYANSLSSAEESLFWENYRMLAKAIFPVSVDSIIASYGLDAVSEGNAKKTIRRYSNCTLATLFGLIVFQMYWFVGTTMRDEIVDLEKEVKDLQLEWVKADQEKLALDSKHFKKDKEIQKLNGEKKEAGNERKAEIEAEIAALTDEKSKIELDKTANVNYLNVKDTAKKQIDNKLAGNFRLLDAWDFYSELLLVSADQRNADLDKLKKDMRAGNFGRDELLKLEDRLWSMEDEVARTSWRTTKLVLALFNQYVLPLLYGLLGSLAYILRTLSTEIQQVTYHRGSNVRYRLRWPLGMLAGVTIGWFFDPTTLKGTAAITPLALAFLAGYSVELLFTGLDRIVGAFTGPHGQAKGQTGGYRTIRGDLTVCLGFCRKK